MTDIPKTQYAVQLVGPDKLMLNKQKPVTAPGQHQILARVEAVGLCFSDLKLLKQFSSHVRKGEITSGIAPEILREIPSYVPGDKPTVPGHEAVVRIAAVGDGVKRFEPGRRYLVETDYRWLPTDGSNAAFGYNFEGALQQYVLMDERIITSPDGQSMLIPAADTLAASAVALVEPWACVEHSYTALQRRAIKTDGRMLIVADIEPRDSLLDALLNRFGRAAHVTWLSKSLPPLVLKMFLRGVNTVSQLCDDYFDDVIYFGSNPEMVESLFPRVAAGGLFNVVLCGGKFGRAVVTPIGKVHYSAIRIIGTGGHDPAESMDGIPQSGEIREHDKINIIGAGGPMGMMHVIRNIRHAARPAGVFAADIDNKRLAVLSKIAAPLAKKHNVEYRAYNPAIESLPQRFNYVALMVPIPDLIAESVAIASEGAVINIFAGIAAEIAAPIDLDSYIEKRLYFVGTSGSVLGDMQQVLRAVDAGRLDTNDVVGAVSGPAGAAEGIGAIENRSIAGKIIVYPDCRDMQLIPLEKLKQKMPQVAQHLHNGLWTKQAEEVLLRRCV